MASQDHPRILPWTRSRCRKVSVSGPEAPRSHVQLHALALALVLVLALESLCVPSHGRR